MSTVKKPEFNPESYDPKIEPAIINKLKALKAEVIIPDKLPKTKTLDGIVSPDEPWVGSCQYLLCFTSLFMHIEKHNTDYYADQTTRTDFNLNFGNTDDKDNLAQMNRERIYKVFLTVTGMGLINHWSDTGKHHNYEVAKNYIARSMKFAGYKYDTVENTSKDTIMEKIKTMINSNIPVLARYNSSWALIIGYDSDENSIMMRKGNSSVVIKDYEEGIEYLVCVMDTGCEKSDLKTIISDIIETMETSGKGVGLQGYYDAIDFYLNDENFNTNDTVKINQMGSNTFGYFIGHAESRGFSGQGFSWRFLNYYDEANKMADFYNKLSYYGDQHHQIGWSGNNAYDNNSENIKSRPVRKAMVYAIYCMVENDMMICRLLKELIGLKTPDVLVARDRETGRVYQTQIQTQEITFDKIMDKVKVKSTDIIDFNNDLIPPDNSDWQINGLKLIPSDDTDFNNGSLPADNAVILKSAANYGYIMDSPPEFYSFNC